MFSYLRHLSNPLQVSPLKQYEEEVSLLAISFLCPFCPRQRRRSIQILSARIGFRQRKLTVVCHPLAMCTPRRKKSVVCCWWWWHGSKNAKPRKLRRLEDTDSKIRKKDIIKSKRTWFRYFRYDTGTIFPSITTTVFIRWQLTWWKQLCRWFWRHNLLT